MSRNKERILTYLLFIVLTWPVRHAYAATFNGVICYFVSKGVCSVVTVANPLPVTLTIVP